MKWLKFISEVLQESLRNALLDQVDTLRNQISGIKPKRTLVKYIGWALLYAGKPFTYIGNWFWKMHRKVLDWNK